MEPEQPAFRGGQNIIIRVTVGLSNDRFIVTLPRTTTLAIFANIIKDSRRIPIENQILWCSGVNIFAKYPLGLLLGQIEEFNGVIRAVHPSGEILTGLWDNAWFNLSNSGIPGEVRSYLETMNK